MFQILKGFAFCAIGINIVHTGYAETLSNANVLITENFAKGMQGALTQKLSAKADNDAVVHIADNETITGAKTFSNVSIPLVVNRLNSNTGSYAAAIFDRPTATGNDSNIAFYFKSGGRFGGIVGGGIKDAGRGQIVMAPAYNGTDPYLRTDFTIIAKDASSSSFNMQGDLSITGSASVSTDVAQNSNSNQVATTKWTNEKIDTARRTIPVGSADATEYAEIWIQ